MGQEELQAEESVLEESASEENHTEETEIEHESPEESVRAALAELEGENQGDQGEEAEAAEQGSDKEPVQQVETAPKETPVKSQKKTVESEDEFDPDLQAPERLKAHEKAWFNKIPQKGLKKAISRSIREMEAQMTRNNREAAREAKESRGIREAVAPYIDQFTERGIPIDQGIAQLCLVQKRLTDSDNPKLQRQTWLALGRDIGMDLTGLEGETVDSTDISNHPQYKALENQIRGLRESIEPITHQNKEASTKQYNEAFQSTLNELQDVQQEVDANGEYVRRELMEDASFLESWKPLVSGLVKSEKLSYADAGRKAYDLLKGKPFTKLNRTRIPAANNQNSRAVSAAVSVRGRVSSPAAPTQNTVDVPKNETPEQSVRAALAEIRAGRG